MGAKSSAYRDRWLKVFSTGDSVLSFIYVKFFFRFWSSLGPLGSLLGPLEALLGDLWTQKRVKNMCFLRVLKRQFFGL